MPSAPLSHFRRALSALLCVGALSVALPADAYEPLLHEFIPPSDSDDLTMGVTTPSGDLPAAIDTESGVVRAPEQARGASASGKAYGEPLVPNTSPTYRPDRDTRRPPVVHYDDDPFTPSTAPYKRLHAYDAVGPGYALKVHDMSLAEVSVGGTVRPGEDSFYADLALDFTSASSVLIPSVGPGARILGQHVTPSIPVEVWRDGADNWYAHTAAPKPGTVRLVMQVAIARQAFGGNFDMPTWANMPHSPALPPVVAKAAAKVAAAMGLSRALSPAQNTELMVDYFRSFTPSSDPPNATGDIYLDLALSQKGVCRHRAFAFLVTALGMGIPARMVLNEAHAWVEVLGQRWQRIDLGGAAADIEEGIASDRPRFEPPSDPFAWPSGKEAESGQRVTERGRAEANASGRGAPSIGAGRGASAPQGSPSAWSSAAPVSSDPTSGDESGVAESRAREADARPTSKVILESGDAQVHRGAPLAIQGRVEALASGCGQLRVDLALRTKDAVEASRAALGSQASRATKIGSLTTDVRGVFAGKLYLPLGFPVGEYQLVSSTPGDAHCGPSSGSP